MTTYLEITVEQADILYKDVVVYWRRYDEREWLAYRVGWVRPSVASGQYWPKLRYAIQVTDEESI